MTKQTSKAAREAHGIKNGYRSGLEDKLADWLTENKWEYLYEPFPITYVQPAKSRKYTLDFLLVNGVVIETKGRFLTADRQKHLLLKKQHPDLDLRFVFSNPNQKISKGSKTTYAMWCEKHGFLYSKELPPKEWLEEAPEEKRIAALEDFILAEQERGRVIGFNAWPRSQLKS